MAFSAEVQSLVGTVTTSEVAQWMTDGVKEIINMLPLKLKQKCATATGVGTDFKVDLDGLGEVLYVTRENADAGYLVPCREIPSMYGGLAEDSSNLMFYGTATDPVYWIDGDTAGEATLYVKPTPTAAQPAIVHHVGYPIFVSSGSGTYDITSATAIPNFPDEAEYLVVLYASIKALQNKMNEKSASLPSLSKPPIPVAPTMAEKSVSITGTAPTYIPPVLSLSTLSSISDLSISAVAPVPPVLSDSSVSFSASVPTFTPPVMNAPDYSDTENWITTEEDSEMLESRVKVIAEQISEYSAKIKESQAQFEKELEIYKTQFAKSVTDAELSSQDDAQKIQKFVSEIQSYQAIASNEVEEYQINMKKNIDVFTSKTQTELSKYQADIQNQLNVFNKESSEYQAKLQKDLQDAQLAESKEGRDLQKYSQELASYQAEVQASVQEFTSNIQKHSTDYQWLQSQYTQLKQDYSQGIQILIGGRQPMSQQKQQQGEG